MRKRPGFGGLFIIGGKEDKKDERVILRMLAKQVVAHTSTWQARTRRR